LEYIGFVGWSVELIFAQIIKYCALHSIRLVSPCHFVENLNRKAQNMNKIVFGNARDMEEVESNSVHLVVTSPPYFNAPFDYPDLFESYEQFLKLVKYNANLEKIASKSEGNLQKQKVRCYE
jgi:hypothetical protein